MGLKETINEGLKESEENVIRNWRSEDPCYVMTESLAILSPLVMWKIENVPSEHDDLAMEISGLPVFF